MVAIAVNTVLSWAILALVGLLALTPLRRAHRAVWLPAAPAVGACVLAVVLTTTSLVVEVPVGLIAVGLVLGGCVLIGLRRGRRPWQAPTRSWSALPGAAAVGGVGALSVLLPNLRLHSPSVVAAGASNDAFYYASEAAYLMRRALLPVPVPTTVMGTGYLPVNGPTTASVHLSLRMGQPMVQSTVDFLTGRDALQTSMTLMAVYVLMAAGVAVTIGRLLRWRMLTGWVFAILVSTSIALIDLVRQQNQDSLLGVALGLLAAAAVIAAARHRAPRLLAAMSVAGLVACYVENLLFVLPLIVGVAALPAAQPLPGPGCCAARRSSVWRWCWPRWHGSAASGHCCPPRTGGDNFPSPFLRVPVSQALSRMLGTVSGTNVVAATDGLLRVETIALGAVAAAGLVAALLFSPLRSGWALLLVVAGGYAVRLTVAERGYSQGRVVTLLIPFLLFMAVAGWDGLWQRLDRGPGRRAARVGLGRSAGRLRFVGVTVAVLTTVGFAGSNVLSSTKSYEPAYADAHHVGPAYTDVADWVAAHGGPQGRDVAVFVPLQFDQSWMTYVLRRDPAVQYPSLNPSNLRIRSFWRREPARYWITGSAARVAGPTSAQVLNTGQFTVWDTTRGPVVAVIPGAGGRLWSGGLLPGGLLGAPPGAEVLLARSPQASRQVVLYVRSTQGYPSMHLELLYRSGPPTRVSIGPAPTPVVLDVPDQPYVVIGTTPLPGTAANRFSISGVAAPPQG